jgi:uncharacterized membrane protein
MMDLLRILGQVGFTVFYAVVMLLTAIFVLPIVWLRDFWAARQGRSTRTLVVALMAVTAASSLLLSGCTSLDTVTERLESSVSRSRDVVDRSLEFAQDAPAAPYEPSGSAKEYARFAEDNGLQLTGDNLAHIAAAAELTKTDPALVATIIEQELRWLDDGELERDILSALTGENSSIGIGQVRVSTAQEVEQEDPFGILSFTGDQTADEARTELVRRLANDDWNILYASTYIYLLQNRYIYSSPLDLAQRYVGASPEDPQVGDQAELFDLFEGLFE